MLTDQYSATNEWWLRVCVGVDGAVIAADNAPALSIANAVRCKTLWSTLCYCRRLLSRVAGVACCVVCTGQVLCEGARVHSLGRFRSELRTNLWMSEASGSAEVLENQAFVC